MDKYLLEELSLLKGHYAKIELLYKIIKKFTEDSIFDVQTTVEMLQDDIVLVAETIGIQADTIQPDPSMHLLGNEPVAAAATTTPPRNNTDDNSVGPS